MKKQREVQEINASSMADISFLLLVFFLVTTTMSTDEGLSRILPKMKDPNQQQTEQKIKPRNLMEILVNSENRIMVNGEEMEVSQIKEHAKEFIDNTDPNNEKLPEVENVTIPGYGSIPAATQHVISLQNDRGTEYGKYIEVENELVAAYDELRDALSQKIYKKNFNDLTDEQQKNIKLKYPSRLSEAEPKTYGGAQ